MRLVTIESVRDRLAVPDMETVNRAIREVLDGVTEQLEADIRTTFPHQAGIVDLFYVEDSNLRGSRFSEKFLLSRGQVYEGTTALQVEVAATKLNLLEGSASVVDLRDTAEAGVEHADQFVLVDAPKGIVTIQDYRLIRAYVQVTYDAGIVADGSKTNLFLQTGDKSVSDDLKELARAMAMLELTSSDAFAGELGVSSKERTKADMTRRKILQDKVDRLLDKLTRYDPGAHGPVGTS